MSYSAWRFFEEDLLDLTKNDQLELKEWCKRGSNDFTVYCDFCKVFINISRGKYRIFNHADSPRHRAVLEAKQESETLEIIEESDVKPGSSSESKPWVSDDVKVCKSMSSYEQLLHEKRAKNLAFLKSLGIDEAKNEFKDVINSTRRKRERTVKEKTDPVIQRVSKRRKEHVDYTDDLPTSADALRMKFRPAEQTFKKVLKLQRDYENFLKDFREVVEADKFVQQPPMLYDKDVFKQLSHKASLRVMNPCGFAWYPSSDNLILAAGDNSGNLNLWNIKDSDFDFHPFPIHDKKISNLQFNPYSSFNLISSSLDGSLLCCDFKKQTFTEVLRSPDRGCSYFDSFSPHSYVVSLTNGDVVIIDRRTLRNKETSYRQTTRTCHESLINSVSVHPDNKDYFVTAGRDRKFCVWDLRKWSDTPVIEKTYKKSVFTASFSPLSGKFLLIKSPDETNIFDCTNMIGGNMKCHRVLKNIEDDKNSLTRPVWLPNSDDTFTCIFDVKEPAVHICDKDLNIYDIVTSDGLSGIKQFVTFHPYQAALASVTKERINICA